MPACQFGEGVLETPLVQGSLCHLKGFVYQSTYTLPFYWRVILTEAQAMPWRWCTSFIWKESDVSLWQRGRLDPVMGRISPSNLVRCVNCWCRQLTEFLSQEILEPGVWSLHLEMFQDLCCRWETLYVDLQVQQQTVKKKLQWVDEISTLQKRLP